MGNVFKNVLGALGNKEVTIKAAGNCKVGKKASSFPSRSVARRSRNWIFSDRGIISFSSHP